jgi:hypothetical protein
VPVEAPSVPPVAFDDGTTQSTGSVAAGGFPWERGRDGTEVGTPSTDSGRDDNSAEHDQALDTMITEYFRK